jgi:ribulose-5-phosphate 4-epimerase/fuculose-1-phosphate aldolase
MDWGLLDEEVRLLVSRSAGIPYVNSAYPSEKQLRFELSIAHHLFAHYKMDELVWNHLSARLAPASDKYLITSFPFMFEDITPGNLSVSSDNYTGMVIHTAIYDKRPDVKAICHLHSTAALAVSCLQEGMQFFSQESAGFYGKVSYHEWEGMSDDTSEQVLHSLLHQ